MRDDLPRWRALVNAVFVLVVLAVAAFGVTKVANRHWHLRETFRARAEFSQVGGLEPGATVRLSGIDAGVVEGLVPPVRPGDPVGVMLRLDAKLKPLIRADAIARVVTQGVVGAKVIEITPGQPDAPPLPPGGVLRSETPIEIADLLRDASETLRQIDEVAVAARDGLGEINAIAATIRSGQGSLGRLVQDEEAYERLLALSSRGEKTLDDLDENLLALKGTWPLSMYFNRRGFSDRDRILFQPASERERRVLTEADLFVPGRAVLTAQGRRKLDEVASWFKKVRRPESEVVIAAFHDDQRGDDLAELLSQEQADAVRNYLVQTHSIASKGWFSSRKVASVGFGKQVPRTAVDESAGLPPRRVEIILFTPQT
jgi:phospholipid/cholesterol/gamma-HCH transport system substrate-binding protein